MPRLLLVHHVPSRSVGALADAAERGARHPDLEGVEVVVRAALDTSVDDVLAADGYVLGTPANFGYMSGALKHVFDSVFLQVGGALDGLADAAPADAPSTRGRPYALWVHGRYDTTGAVRAVEGIVGALGWERVQRPVEVVGDVDDEALAAVHDAAATVAAHLVAG